MGLSQLNQKHGKHAMPQNLSKSHKGSKKGLENLNTFVTPNFAGGVDVVSDGFAGFGSPFAGFGYGAWGAAAAPFDYGVGFGAFDAPFAGYGAYGAFPYAGYAGDFGAYGAWGYGAEYPAFNAYGGFGGYGAPFGAFAPFDSYALLLLMPRLELKLLLTTSVHSPTV